MPEQENRWQHPDFGVEKLGSMPLAQLQELARAYGMDDIARMRKAVLVSLLSRIGELQALNARQLQALAAEHGLQGAGRMKKLDLVRRLASQEVVREANPVSGETDRRQRRTLDLPSGFRLQSAAGWLLSLTGVVGVMLSLMLLVSLPLAARWGTAKLQSFLAGASIQTRGIAASIQIAIEAMDQTSKTLQDSIQALDGIDNTLQDSGPRIESTGVLLGEQLPETLDETRQALLSAEAGAQAIDQVLRGMNSVRLITGVNYEPEQSLDQGLIAMAKGLEPLPSTLKRVEADLASVGDRFSEFRPILRTASDDIEALRVDLDQVSSDLRMKGESLEDLAVLLDTTAEHLPERAPFFTAILVVPIGWLVLGQVGLYFVGEWVRKSALRSGAS